MTHRFPAMLFAAGLGTRMGALTADRPKPLIHVSGATLLDHALTLTDVPCVERRVVNVHYKAQMIRDHLADLDIASSAEDPLLETGGGLRHALPLLGTGPVITLNTDAIWLGPQPVTTLCAAWKPQMEALLMLVPKTHVRGHSGPGDFTRSMDGRLHRAPDLIYSGLQIIRTDSLPDVTDAAFSLNVVWNQMAARRGLYGVVFDGKWCDVGRPEAIPLAEALLRENADV